MQPDTYALRRGLARGRRRCCSRGPRSVVTLAVVDASVLVAFYPSDDPRRVDVVNRLVAGDALYAPAHLDAEVVSALCGLARVKPAVERAVPNALRHPAGFPIRRMPLAPLFDRIWDLRANVTAYDAAYVALAEHLSAPVITCDAKLTTVMGRGAPST
ncbi:MAG: type II toxin-antitoxin system VapC family toxin [Jatrophihabitantaceae bacterium]